MNREEINYRSTVVKEDLRTFFDYTTFVKPALQIQLIGMLTVLSVFLLFRGGWMSIVGGIVTAIGLWFFASRILLRVRYLKTIPKCFAHEIAVAVNSDCLSITDSDGKTKKYRWEKIVDARETRRHYFLYEQPDTAVILPKRDIPEGQREGVENLITGKLGKKISR